MFPQGKQKQYTSSTSALSSRQCRRRRRLKRSHGRQRKAKYNSKVADTGVTSGIKNISTDVPDTSNDGSNDVASSGTGSIE